MEDTILIAKISVRSVKKIEFDLDKSDAKIMLSSIYLFNIRRWI